MNYKNLYKVLAATVIFSLTGTQAALACSWAAYNNGKAAVVARTMDWYHNDNAVMKGHGKNITVKAAGTPNALEYKSKYASMQVHSFNGVVTDVMNEKGLQGSLLYLEGSTMPKAQAGRKDVATTSFLAYAVDNFATVKELVDSLTKINIVAAPFSGLNGADGKAIANTDDAWPGHFAFVDPTGDKVIIEFWEHDLKIYHGKDHSAMTNEPAYHVHQYFDAIGNRPTASITPVDRRAKAKYYLADMHKRAITDPARALLAMRGVLANMNAGSEELDPIDNEVYPTIWGAVIDLNTKTYYLSRYNKWCSEIYNFTQFSPEKAEVVDLKPMSGADAPDLYDNIHAQHPSK